MNIPFQSETGLSAALLLLLFLLINPFDIWMPTAFSMTILAAVVALFFLFTAFVWRETATDEREYLHRLLSARFAYLSGSAVLLIGVVWQSLSHSSDPWLAVALGTMIAGKIIGRIYAEKYC